MHNSTCTATKAISSLLLTVCVCRPPPAAQCIEAKYPTTVVDQSSVFNPSLLLEARPTDRPTQQRTRRSENGGGVRSKQRGAPSQPTHSRTDGNNNGSQLEKRGGSVFPGGGGSSSPPPLGHGRGNETWWRGGKKVKGGRERAAQQRWCIPLCTSLVLSLFLSSSSFLSQSLPFGATGKPINERRECCRSNNSS